MHIIYVHTYITNIHTYIYAYIHTYIYTHIRTYIYRVAEKSPYTQKIRTSDSI